MVKEGRSFGSLLVKQKCAALGARHSGLLDIANGEGMINKKWKKPKLTILTKGDTKHSALHVEYTCKFGGG